MTKFTRYLVPIVIGLVAFAASQYLFPASPAADTAKLECTFANADNSLPAELPNSATKINAIKFEAELSGRSVHDDVELWSARGIASFEGSSQNLTGPIFIGSGGSVRGLSLHRDRYPIQSVDLRISTLNQSEKLDWNEEFAFVYFEGASDKMAHPYNYHCTVIGAKAQ